MTVSGDVCSPGDTYCNPGGTGGQPYSTCVGGTCVACGLAGQACCVAKADQGYGHSCRGQSDPTCKPGLGCDANICKCTCMDSPGFKLATPDYSATPCVPK
ncbi:hypothetical protein ABPG75_013691 [Micractinium tetrahymenae]